MVATSSVLCGATKGSITLDSYSADHEDRISRSLTAGAAQTWIVGGSVQLYAVEWRLACSPSSGWLVVRPEFATLTRNRRGC